MTVKICPERDVVCPHGLSCPYADTPYSCKDNWITNPIPTHTAAYTAAEVEAVAQAVLEAAANLAGNFTQAQHAAHDISTGVFPGQSPNREAMAGCIRALDLTTIIARATGGKSDD